MPAGVTVGVDPCRPRLTDGQLAAASLWAAARYGIHGPGIDPVTGRRVPAAGLVDELLHHVRPALAGAGDDGITDAQVRCCRSGETGAERQAGFGRHGAAAIVDDAAGRLRTPSRVVDTTVAYPARGRSTSFS